jgi:hypothetical protein
LGCEARSIPTPATMGTPKQSQFAIFIVFPHWHYLAERERRNRCGAPGHLNCARAQYVISAFSLGLSSKKIGKGKISFRVNCVIINPLSFDRPDSESQTSQRAFVPLNRCFAVVRLDQRHMGLEWSSRGHRDLITPRKQDRGEGSSVLVSSLSVLSKTR